MKLIIGRKEKISLEEWGLSRISAKIDTGAYTSAIHCEYAQVKMIGGKEVLEFILLSPSNKHFKNQLITTEHFSRKKVKNSFGQVEIRYKVTTKISIFGKRSEEHTSELQSRPHLVCRLLLEKKNK